MEVSNDGVDHSVLLRFTAPGSFSCNLWKKSKTGVKGKSGNWKLDWWMII